jgi:hypothetical protein
MALKRKTRKPIRSAGGYLFCNYCGGYYKLKDDETLRDYDKCECGNPLEFCKTYQDLQLKSTNLHRNREVFDSFQNRLVERRESLISLIPQIEVDGNFLDFTSPVSTPEEEGVWDIIDREFNATSQKNYLNIILEQERLMTAIQSKKDSVHNPTFTDKVSRFYQETDPGILLGAVIVVLIIILILAVLWG